MSDESAAENGKGGPAAGPKGPAGSEDPADDRSLVSVSGEMPANLIVVPLNEHVLFPGMTIPIVYAPGAVCQHPPEYSIRASSSGPTPAEGPRHDVEARRPQPCEVSTVRSTSHRRMTQVMTRRRNVC